MSTSKDGQKDARNDFIIWLLISFAIVVVLHVILPFPISFIASIITIFGLGIYRDDRALRKAGLGGIIGWYKSVLSSRFSPQLGNAAGYQPLRFSCINCGNEHDKIGCPNCGSKGVRPL